MDKKELDNDARDKRIDEISDKVLLELDDICQSDKALAKQSDKIPKK